MSARHASRTLFPGGSDVAGDGQTILVDGTPDIIWSRPLSLALSEKVSTHLEWNGADSTGTTLGTGNLVAALSVWCSNKESPATPDDDEADPGDWVEITALSFADEPDGSAGKGAETFSLYGYRWFIIKCDRTSGDGNVRGWAHAKD